MAVCQISANSGSYGVGIRIAFYLQWFGMIITSWVLESDALNLKFINALTTAATSVGLVLNLGKLQSVEIYIVLMLACGTLYFAVPVYLWRLVTCCRPWWDPGRWARTKLGWLFRVFNYSIYGALLSLQIWFWCTGVHERRKIDAKLDTDTNCEQFGFFFAQARLDGPGLVTANIIIHFTMLLVGTGVSARSVGMFEDCYLARRKERRSWSITKNRILSLQHFQTICDLIVAAIITVAIELVIFWNKIKGANDLDSAAQLMPPVITGAYLVRSLCVCISGSDRESQDSRGSYFPRGSNDKRSGHPSRRRSTHRRRRRSSYRRRRSRRVSRASPDFLDEYPDMFEFSELSVPTPPASFGGLFSPPASVYCNVAPNYYDTYAGGYAGGYAGDDIPPVATTASLHGWSQDSFVGGEGFIRL